MITPFDYQKQGLNEIWKGFKENTKQLYQLSTGGGKTFIFSFLAKHWIDKKQTRILILCHRTELISQTIASLNQIGVTCEAVTSKTKKLNHSSDVYVAMVETANNRLKKDPYFFKEVGLLIVDECHILIFDKLFSHLPNSKILGCTATPVVLKRIKYYKCKYCKTQHYESTECCDYEVDEWSRPFTLSEIYEDIITGPNIDELIKRNRLIKEISFVEKYIDESKLKTDSDGEFTGASLDEQYSSDSAVFNVLLNYEKLCKGKKTLIFNSSAKVNLLLYSKFKEAGHNVKMFDSINECEPRQTVIDWFKDPNNRDSVLLNVSVFTTGFDVTDIEAVILNRATASLSLFLQMVGRGGRITNHVYKDNFILIDGGGNIDRHQEWSDPTRDWRRIFSEGIGKDKMRKEDALDVQSCDACGFLYPKSEPKCPDCGYEITPKPKNEKIESLNLLTPIREIPPPNGEKIYQYTISKEENINFSFKVLISQIVDMFIFYRVTKETYVSAKQKGELDRKIKKMIQKCYFLLLSKQDIKADNHRTIKYLLDKTVKKLDIHYNLI
ncbi:MAG: DEAD/DEAH box helicase family protein [Bacteroidota bacterium]